MKNPKPATMKHRRVVRIDVCLPASVELIVGTNENDPDETSDWEILSVVNVSCEATPQMIRENIHEMDSEALAVAAANAEDLP